MAEKQPTNKQLKKFYEWCGFKLTNDIVWIDSNDNRIHKAQELSLSILFQYAITKLQSKGYQVNILCQATNDFVVYIFSLNHNKTVRIECDDLTLGLFWSIFKVIDNEVKNVKN